MNLTHVPPYSWTFRGMEIAYEDPFWCPQPTLDLLASDLDPTYQSYVQNPLSKNNFYDTYQNLNN